MNKYTQDKLKDKAHGKGRRQRHQDAGSERLTVKNYLGCLGLLFIVGVFALFILGVPWYFIAGNIESMQKEQHCTISEAHEDGAGGGVRASSTSSTIIIKTQECGSLAFKGDLGTGSVDGAVDLLNAHAGEQVVFWLHPYQLPRWTGAAVDVQRVELP